MICGKKTKCVLLVTRDLRRIWPSGSPCILRIRRNREFVIRVVTYSRFDFTDDLRPPRSDASPKKGYRHERNIVATFLYSVRYTVDPIKTLLPADKLSNALCIDPH